MAPRQPLLPATCVPRAVCPGTHQDGRRPYPSHSQGQGPKEPLAGGQGAEGTGTATAAVDKPGSRLTAGPGHPAWGRGESQGRTSTPAACGPLLGSLPRGAGNALCSADGQGAPDWASQPSRHPDYWAHGVLGDCVQAGPQASGARWGRRGPGSRNRVVAPAPSPPPHTQVPDQTPKGPHHMPRLSITPQGPPTTHLGSPSQP